MLMDYAKKHSFDVPEGWIFKDDGITGRTIQRPAFFRILQDNSKDASRTPGGL